MEVSFKLSDQSFTADLKQGIDISIPLISGADGPNAFFAPPFDASPLKAGDFIGSIKEGAPVNFFNLRLNPHGNGTHTESVNHIRDEQAKIYEVVDTPMMTAELITIWPQKQDDGDLVINKDQVNDAISFGGTDALIIRTMPNDADKMRRVWSGTNPPYMESDCASLLASMGYKHLLIDLPSVDREEDGGKLLSHNAWWNTDDEIRKDATITEMVYIPDEVKDGLYLLDLQVIAFHLDVSPSRPFIYPANKMA